MIILLTSTKQYQQTACKIAGGFSFAEDLDIQIYKTSLHYGDTIYIYSTDMKQLLTTHDVTWSKRDRFCTDQYANALQPEEFPTAPVKSQIRMLEEPVSDLSFEKFNFDKEVAWDE